MAYIQLESTVKCKQCNARLSRVTLEHNCYSCGNDMKKEVQHNSAVHSFLATAPVILIGAILIIMVCTK